MEDEDKIRQKKNETTLLTRDEAAELLKVQPQTLAYWAMMGKGPTQTKIGRKSLYRKDILEKYIENQTVKHDNSWGE